MAEIEHSYERIKASWMTGSSAVRHAPDEWRDLVAVEAVESELRLVALVGQALQLALDPVPAQDLVAMTDVPRLAYPVLPDQARPRFRRLFEAARSDRWQESTLLRFVAARGYVAHPADWMPSPRDEDVPEVYLPWLGWQAAQDTGRMSEHEPVALTAENWDYFTPAERRAELSALRRSDPSAAGSLIEAKAPDLPAEQRLRLVELLAENLSAEDADFLKSLLADRSGKVKTLAAAFLARLGQGVDAGELETELAGFLKLGKKGLLSRKLKVSANKLKTDAQRRRRAELFEQVALQGLSRALNVSEGDFLEAWAFNDAQATASLCAMVAVTGSDACAHRFAGLLVENGLSGQVPVVAERLEPADRASLAAAIVGTTEADLTDAVLCAGDRLGELQGAEIMRSPAVQELGRAVEKFSAEESSAGRTRRENAVAIDLYALGLLADAPAASGLLREMTDAGLMAIDPKLEMLRFNESLPKREDPKR
ncbi:MAG: DUF5691 domain-containing protein [Pseudomonadota bacterium]